jgi:hypothetical protein
MTSKDEPWFSSLASDIANGSECSSTIFRKFTDSEKNMGKQHTIVIFLILTNTLAVISDRDAIPKAAQIAYGLLLVTLIFAIAGNFVPETNSLHMRDTARNYIAAMHQKLLGSCCNADVIAIICWAIQYENDKLLAFVFVPVLLLMAPSFWKFNPLDPELDVKWQKKFPHASLIFFALYGFRWVKYLLVAGKEVSFNYNGQDVAMDLRVLYVAYAMVDCTALSPYAMKGLLVYCELWDACIPEKVLTSPCEELSFSEFVLNYVKPTHPLYAAVMTKERQLEKGDHHPIGTSHDDDEPV